MAWAATGQSTTTTTTRSSWGGVGTPTVPKGKHSQSWWRNVLGSGPVATALDLVSRPAYAVGSLIEGHPKDALKAISPLTGPLGLGLSKLLTGDATPSFKRVLPGQALANKGLLPQHGFAGGISKFIADVALDPLSYVTFGTSSVLKTAAQKAASEAIMGAAESGGRALTADFMTRVAADVAAAGLKDKKAITVGIRVPFVRGPKGNIKLGESTTAYRALAAGPKAAGNTRVGQLTQELFRPGGTASPVTKAIGKAVQQVTARDKAMLDEQLRGLLKESLVIDKAQGLKRGASAESLARYFDAPKAHPLPAHLNEFAKKVDGVRQELQQFALDAGLIDNSDLLKNYISHLPADRKTVKEIHNRWGKKNPDNPFLTKHRIPGLETFDDWTRNGLNPELNVFKLLQARGYAAIDAIGSRAAKNTAVEKLGLVEPLKALPDVGGAALRYDSALAKLQGVTRRKADEVPTGRATAAESANAVRASSSARSALASPYPLARRNARVTQAAVVRGLTGAATHRVGREVEAAGHTANIRDYHEALAQLMGAKRSKLEWDKVSPKKVMDASALKAMRSGARRDVDRARRELAAARRRPDANSVERAQRNLASAQAAERKAQRDYERIIVSAEKDVTAARVAAAKAGTRNVATTQRALGRAEGAHRAGYVGNSRQIAAAAREATLAKQALQRAEGVAAKRKAFNAELMKSPARVATPEGWQEIRKTWVSLGEKIHGLVPPEVAADLEKVLEGMGRTMTGPAAIYEAGYFINRIGSNWKSLAILSPGFHLRNAYDDGLRAFFAGARNPNSYLQSGRVLRGEDVRFKVDGKMTSGKQEYAVAQALGVVDTGTVAKDVPALSDLGTRRLGRRPGEGAGANVSRKFGTYRENLFRFGTYIDLRKQGYSALEAAERVATHHFDYGDVGLAVAKARRFWLPFVTYTSKAVPYFARQLVQHPGQAAGINKALTELHTASGTNINPSLLPVGQRLGVPIPGFGGKNNPLLLNPEGVSYFSSFNLVDPTQIQRQALAKLPNPLIRSPVEIGTEYSFYRGRRLPDKVRAPNWMQSLAQHGVKVPGYIPTDAERPYRDVLTKKPIPGVDAQLDVIYRNLPIYSQSDLVTGGASRDYQLGLAKYVLGAPVQRFDRLRAQELADYFARRQGQR